MASMVNFWQHKTVLVTGHTGFKGSWLALWLQQLGANVIGVALDPVTQPNLFTCANVAKHMTSVHGDINDYATLTHIFNQYQPEIVFHLAAQALVRPSYLDPITTYTTNIMGTVHVLEAARHCHSVRAIVNVTSDKCYDNKEWLWGYRENEAMGGFDPYSSSKGCAELVTAAYRQSYFNAKSVGLASARAGNVIGGGDWAEDRLIPDIVRACVAKEIVELRHPQAIRPWQHVLESLAGYLSLAELLYRQPSDYSSAWNFGPLASDSKTVAFLVDTMLQQWGSTDSWQLTADATPHEAQHLKLDCTKALTHLNWRPKWDLTTALAATTAWYQAYYHDKDMSSFTHKQIRDYIES